MACPQTENGYTKIANEIYDALIKHRIAGEARQVLDFIIRKTYGFNKKEDAIALSQFCLATGLTKIHICRSINYLIQYNLITKKGNDTANIYRFNKDFDQWKPLPKKITLSKKITTITKKGNNHYPKRDIQKKKENITKDISKQATPADNINPLIKEFEEINPTINYGNKTQRKACEELIKKFGYEKVVNTLNYYKSIRNEKFSPTITTPYMLQQKMGELINYYNKSLNKNKITIL